MNRYKGLNENELDKQRDKIIYLMRRTNNRRQFSKLLNKLNDIHYEKHKRNFKGF